MCLGFVRFFCTLPVLTQLCAGLALFGGMLIDGGKYLEFGELRTHNQQVLRATP